MDGKSLNRISTLAVLCLCLLLCGALAAAQTPPVSTDATGYQTIRDASLKTMAVTGSLKVPETAPAFGFTLPTSYEYRIDNSDPKNTFLFIYPDTPYFSYMAVMQSKAPMTRMSWQDLTDDMSEGLYEVWGGTTDESGYTTLGGQTAVYVKGHYYENTPRTWTCISTYDTEGYFYQFWWLVDTKSYQTDKENAQGVIDSIRFGVDITCSGELKAAFSVDSTKGKVPLKVRFTDKSSGCPGARLYDFGDGSISTSTDPVHTYYSIGSFLPKLTVTKNGVRKTTTLERKIEVTGVSTQSWRVYKQQISKPVFYLKTPPTAQATYSQTSSGHETTLTDTTYGYVIMITVLKEDLSGSGSTLSDLTDLLEEFVEEDGGYIVESNTATLGGKPAARLISTRSTRDGTLFTENILAAWYNGKIVLVNYLAPTKTYEKGLPTGMTAISTFRFI